MWGWLKDCSFQINTINNLPSNSSFWIDLKTKWNINFWDDGFQLKTKLKSIYTKSVWIEQKKSTWFEVIRLFFDRIVLAQNFVYLYFGSVKDKIIIYY